LSSLGGVVWTKDITTDALPPRKDLLRVLTMEATTWETAVTDMSATSRIERPRVGKTGQSGMPNRTIQFPRKSL
jgi:hypothetical protein